MAAKAWSRKFDEPIPLPRGRALVTLKDAGNFITKLPKAEHEAREWLAALAALLSPLAMGTRKLQPGGWQSLPFDEREKIAQMAAETDNCTHDVTPKTEYSDAICAVLLSELHAGGHYASRERVYVALHRQEFRADDDDIRCGLSRGNGPADIRYPVLGMAQEIAACRLNPTGGFRAAPY